MSTIKQIEANRLNAQKSTGPRTAEGKSAARLNALKHGLFAQDPIIPGEDPAHFEALRTSYYDRFQPAAPEEHTLLAAIIRNAWLLERYSNVDTDVWRRAMHYNKAIENLLAASYSWMNKSFGGIQRRLDAAERNFGRDLEFLIKLQTARKKALPAPERT